MNLVVPASFYANKQRSLSKNRWRLKIKWVDLLAAFVGFILGQAVFLQGLAPFGVSYLVIFVYQDIGRLIVISLGVILGSMISRGYLGVGTVVAALIGIYLIRSWHDRIKHDSIKGIIIAGMVLGFYFIVYSVNTDNIYLLLMGVLEVLFILCIGWLFAEGVTDLFSGIKKRWERINLLAILFLLSGLINGLHSLPPIEFMGVSPISILIQTIILVTSFAGGITYAVIPGLFLGLSLSLTGFYDPVFIGVYGFSGLATGYFRDYGKLSSVLGFILVLLIFAGMGMIEYGLQQILVQSFLAGIIFFILPDSVITNLKRYLPGTGELLVEEENYQKELQRRFTERLNEFSQVFSELGMAFKEVSSTDELEEDDMSYFLYVISNRVCKGCEFESHCWDRQFYQTYSQIFKLLSVLESKGKAKGEDFVRLLKGHCRNLNRLKESIDGSLEIYQLNRQWSKLLKNQQAIVGDQLNELSRVIEGFAKELEICGAKKEDLEDKLKIALEEDNLKIISCRITGDAGDDWLNIAITKERCNGNGECRKIFKSINRITSQPMTNYERCCSLEDGQEICHLKFCPARNYFVRVGYAMKAKAGETVSGDSLSYQQLKSGKFLTILSDGMGTGEEAARESRSALRLVQKIIRAGFNHELAVRTVNTALLCRSTEECFATLDISLIDLFNGEVELIKIGAAASFIKRGYEVNVVRGSSLPAGIVQSIEPAVFKRRLQVGDFFIMVTDGVLDAVNIANKEDWMVRLLSQCSFDSPEELAQFIYEQAVGKGTPKDDMTVIVLKLEEEKKIH